MIAPTAVATPAHWNRSRGLVSALRASFVVNLDCVAIQRSNAFENSGEPVRLTVPQPNSVESERYLGPATQASTGSTPETVPSITASLH